MHMVYVKQNPQSPLLSATWLVYPGVTTICLSEANSSSMGLSPPLNLRVQSAFENSMIRKFGPSLAYLQTPFYDAGIAPFHPRKA